MYLEQNKRVFLTAYRKDEQYSSNTQRFLILDCRTTSVILAITIIVFKLKETWKQWFSNIEKH